VRRLKAGIYDCYHVKFTPRIIRLGSQEMIHEEVKEVTIDAVVEKTFATSCKESLELLKKQRAEVAQLKKDLDFVETDPKQADKLQDLKKSLWTAKENMKKNTTFIESTRHSLRTKVLNDAQVVCTTLSSAGMELLSKMQFPFVIIDEACQSVELSALIPLQYGCQNCVLVGGTA
jgi:senataxin